MSAEPHVGCPRCNATGEVPAGPFGGARDRCPLCNGAASIPYDIYQAVRRAEAVKP